MVFCGKTDLQRFMNIFFEPPPLSKLRSYVHPWLNHDILRANRGLTIVFILHTPSLSSRYVNKCIVCKCILFYAYIIYYYRVFGIYVHHWWRVIADRITQFVREWWGGFHGGRGASYAWWAVKLRGLCDVPGPFV